MARKSWLERTKKGAKFPVRVRNRCGLCGKPRGFMRKFGICRICFRDLAHKGEIPGIRKSSW